MSTHKNFDKICVVVLVLCLLITVLFINGEQLGLTVVVDEDDEAHAGQVYFTANDLNGNWDSSGATVITLSGDSASVSGKGAYAYRGDVFISSAGLYVLSGELTDGSIIVDAHKYAKVWLLFDGVTLACSDDACLRVDQADKVFLTLAEGSVNSMTGPVAFSASAEADGTDGVIYAHDDLTINGSGSLSVTAWYRHGIVAKDDLVITGGTVTVKAQADGIRANDSLRVCGAAITVEANDDAISVGGDSSLPVTVENGYFYLESGSLVLNAEDDALTSLGLLNVAGGDLTINAVSDGLRSDTAVSLAGGTLRLESCYEGVEAPVISLSGGEVTIKCRDDGFNASDSIYDYSLTPQVLISGGSLSIVNETAMDADGIDSNGDILISGGTVRVSLPANGTNCALDHNDENGGVCLISGGSVVACGAYTMAKGFDPESEQCSVLYNIAAGVPAGTAISLEDASGTALMSWTAPCSFSSVLLSVPEMQLGESYLMVIGDQIEAITLEEVSASYGSAQSSMFGGSMNWGSLQPRGEFSGEMPDVGERPEPPGGVPSGEMPDMGERPEPPGGVPSGEMPDVGERPEPPGGGFPGGETPDMGERPEPPEGGFPGGETPVTSALPSASQSASADAAEDAAQPVSAAQWLLIGAAFLVLALGILLGVKFEPKD